MAGQIVSCEIGCEEMAALGRKPTDGPDVQSYGSWTPTGVTISMHRCLSDRKLSASKYSPLHPRIHRLSHVGNPDENIVVDFPLLDLRTRTISESRVFQKAQMVSLYPSRSSVIASLKELKWLGHRSALKLLIEDTHDPHFV